MLPKLRGEPGVDQIGSQKHVGVRGPLGRIDVQWQKRGLQRMILSTDSES